MAETETVSVRTWTCNHYCKKHKHQWKHEVKNGDQCWFLYFHNCHGQEQKELFETAEVK